MIYSRIERFTENASIVQSDWKKKKNKNDRNEVPKRK